MDTEKLRLRTLSSGLKRQSATIRESIPFMSIWVCVRVIRVIRVVRVGLDMFWTCLELRGPPPWTCSKPWKRWYPCTMWGQGPARQSGTTNRTSSLFSSILSLCWPNRLGHKRGVWKNLKIRGKRRWKQWWNIKKRWRSWSASSAFVSCGILWHCVAESHHASRLNVANAQDTSDVFAWISRPGMPPEDHHWIWKITWVPRYHQETVKSMMDTSIEPLTVAAVAQRAQCYKSMSKSLDGLFILILAQDSKILIDEVVYQAHLVESCQNMWLFHPVSIDLVRLSYDLLFSFYFHCVWMKCPRQFGGRVSRVSDSASTLQQVKYKIHSLPDEALRRIQECLGWHVLRGAGRAETCWEVLRSAETCWDVLRCAEMCWDLQRCSEMCWDVLRISKV